MQSRLTITLYKDEVKRWLLLVFLAFPHAKPGYLSELPLIDRVFDGWRIVSFLIILTMVFVSRRVSWSAMLITVMELFLVANTFVKGGVVQRSIVSAASVIAVVLLYDLFAGDIDYKKVFYSSQLWCFELLIYINLITEIIWPSGMYSANSGHFLMRKCYFLGYYNNHTMWFVPALLFAWLYASETRKYFRAVVLTAAIVASALITWSGGVLASLGAMIIVFVLTKRRSWRIFNYYFYWLIHILFFVWVILLNTNNIISRLVESLFHKGHSFDLRISLWAKYVMLIGNHWFTGYGIWDQMYREDQVGFYWGMHAHNMILEILYQGGIVYLVMFVALVLMSGKMLMIESQESRIISIAFLGWIVATLVEPFAGGFLMGMFIIAYYSNTNTEFVEASSGLETYIMRN